MSTSSPGDPTGGRIQRTLGHLRAATDELFVRSARDAGAWLRRTRRRKAVTIALLATVALFVATTRVDLHGHWVGLFLLRSESGRPLELKDDLKLGDGSRLVAGISFAPVRDLLASEGRVPRLELQWDEKEGSGSVTNFLSEGAQLQTFFGRYVDDWGASPAGLFVGGSTADVAAGPGQSQSGMALRDARGWHHLWCNVNELLLVGTEGRKVFPGEWTFRGSRVLVDDWERVVLESEHEVTVGAAHLRMERYAYFKAGRRFFRLGINLVNVGEQPVTVSYGYGDEPWVGEFGSADGNIGWTEQGIVPMVAWLDPRASRWGGIVDTKSRLANFISWEGSTPDGAYFGNHPGTPSPAELGTALSSNEIFVGLEWRDRTIDPGETFSIRLTLGLAAGTSTGVPTVPQGAENRR